jgi:hypothetical protein
MGDKDNITLLTLLTLYPTGSRVKRVYTLLTLPPSPHLLIAPSPLRPISPPPQSLITL